VTPAWETSADLVVVGTGVAGLTAAVHAHDLGLRVLVLTKRSTEDGSTRWAQGGVAVVLPGEHDPDDSVRRHVEDTLAAGGGLCDPDSTGSILAAGPGAMSRLRARGAVFDDDGARHLALTREGGHSAFRVVHAGGDATGAEVERALVVARRDRTIPLLEWHTATRVVLDDAGEVAGLEVLDDRGRAGLVRTPSVLLATGGVGQLYRATSNPPVATADGLALALRAGATVTDVEFVQFHPTVLYTGPDAAGRCPLVTEALRGEGATLVDGAGRPVMRDADPRGDLAPRDVVAATVVRRMAENPGGISDHVFLDATDLPADVLTTRFPTVVAACRAIGVDPVTDPIPVVPAAHYHCGGVTTDQMGRTSVPGLYAAGETARTGLNGANRLASNSLLEGLVVGERVAAAAAASGRPARRPSATADRPLLAVDDLTGLRRLMSEQVAVERDETGLSAVGEWIDGHAAPVTPSSGPDWERVSLTLAARALVAAARWRRESRGCHVRTDHPERDDAGWRRSVPVRLDDDGIPAPDDAPVGGAVR
jgi:L-aspartate oxidase